MNHGPLSQKQVLSDVNKAVEAAQKAFEGEVAKINAKTKS